MTDLPATPPSVDPQNPPGDVPGPTGRDCPVCGTAIAPGASFCEACGTDLAAAAATSAAAAAATGAPGRLDDRRAGAGAVAPPAAGPTTAPEHVGTMIAAATPQTAPVGEESPLDVGWTGPVPSSATAPAQPDTTCTLCGQGQIVDGYCDHCGSPPPNPRDHFTEAPAAWVGGVCDIGKRHTRNEDAMALSAAENPGRRAVLVVCDGVSMATDSHIASMAAARAAMAVLDQPFPKGVGTEDAWAAGAARAMTKAVTTANAAVAASIKDEVPNPPSCTFAAAVVEDGVIVAGNVGDSRVYWLPDMPDHPATQLGRDDSFAQEQILAGVPRADAETGPHSHSITRWLGTDSPDDLTPHMTTVRTTPETPGWLMVCSDGLWNYCSEAEAMRTLLHGAVTRVGAHGPAAIAQALVDFANDQGGRDNITVALARLAGQGSKVSSGSAAAAVPEGGDPVHG